jgi:hypothetical protein
MATIALRWLLTNVRQDCDGGPGRDAMYLPTVVSATWNPSLINSP